MFIYSYFYVCSVLGILYYCVVLCTVCVEMRTVLLPPGVNPTAVNKHFTYHLEMLNSVLSFKIRFSFTVYHAISPNSS
jgi:hypothetical protein